MSYSGNCSLKFFRNLFFYITLHMVSAMFPFFLQIREVHNSNLKIQIAEMTVQRVRKAYESGLN